MTYKKNPKAKRVIKDLNRVLTVRYGEKEAESALKIGKGRGKPSVLGRVK